jgi:hypothetical protein
MKGRYLSTIVAFLGVWLLYCTNAFAFEVLAFGTSAINCHGVPRDQIFSVKLQGNLRADGIDATVVNAGQDGDLPMWMPKRIQPLLAPNTRLVIFEPGPNAKNKEQTLPYAEEVLALLQKRQIATIYVSVGSLQSNDDADKMAKKYGAIAYGHWAHDIPLDAKHFQFDQNQGGKGRGGHLTAEGCALWARNMTPLVESVIKQAGIK